MIHIRDATLDVRAIERHRFDPVGQCIYCGSTEKLTKEHIVPFALGGNLILPESSCRECARVTGRFEREVLRGPLRDVRVFLGIQSRSRHRDAPDHLFVEARYGDEWRTVHLPRAEYPVVGHFLRLSPPGYFFPEAYDGDISVAGYAAYTWGPHPAEVLKAIGADEIRVRQFYAVGAFARMIAKIGYGTAVAFGRLDPARGRPEVVSAILGDSTRIGRWVGVEEGSPERTPKGTLHATRVHADASRGMLLARVQLFSNSGTPTYVVVLGPFDAPCVKGEVNRASEPSGS